MLYSIPWDNSNYYYKALIMYIVKITFNTYSYNRYFNAFECIVTGKFYLLHQVVSYFI